MIMLDFRLNLVDEKLSTPAKLEKDIFFSKQNRLVGLTSIPKSAE